MKKVTRTVAMMALVFGALTVTANEGKLSLVTNTQSNSIVFELSSQATETTIRLIDADNNVVYFENIESVIYAKQFNLKNLKEGLYYFTTEDSLKTVTYTIKVASTGVKIIKRKENAKPVFKKENGMVYLNLLNLDRKDVKIEIFDSSNRLVFAEKHVNEMIIEKAFNFKKAFRDSYTVVVRDGDNTYYENVEVK